MAAPSNSYGLRGSQPSPRSWRWLYGVFMALLAVAGCSLTTQMVALHYRYQEALGKVWFVALDQAWYAPWSIFAWKSQYPDVDGYMEHAISMGQALFIVPQFVTLALFLLNRKPKGNKDLHGSAHWATEEEVRATGLLDGAGVYVGGWLKKYTGLALLKCLLMGRHSEEVLYLRHDGSEHLIGFAPTRSGKGISWIITTLLSWPHSSVTLDIKGENWALASGYQQSIEHKTLCFNPADITGTCACFNPLEELRINTFLAVQDVQNMAMMLVDPEGKGLASHWDKAAFSFFSALILHSCIMIRELHHRTATLQDLILMMADESRDTEELLQEMLDVDHAVILEKHFPKGTGGAEAHTFIASSAREMMNKDVKEASGVLSSAAVNMALYRDPVVNMNTARSDFRVADLMNHDSPVNLYLVVGPTEIDRVRPLIRLILDMIIRRLCSKMEFEDGTVKASYKHRLLLMLDEFTALGKLPIIEKAIAYSAGYGVKMFLIVQDIIQLNSVYGKDNAIMSNCHTRLAYAPNTVETAKVLSDMTGKTTVVEQKTSISGSRIGSMKNASISVSETARALLTPDECMRIPGLTKDPKTGKTVPGDTLVFTAGHSPIYGKQIMYFDDPVFLQRAKIPAPSLSDSLYHRPTSSVPALGCKKHPQTPASNPQKQSRTYESYLEE